MNKFMRSIKQQVMGQCAITPRESEIDFSIEPSRKLLSPMSIGEIVRYTLSYTVDAVTTNGRTSEYVEKQVVAYMMDELYGDVYKKILELDRALFIHQPDKKVTQLIDELIKLTEPNGRE